MPVREIANDQAQPSPDVADALHGASLWLRGSRMHSGSPVSHRRLGITYASYSKKV